MQGTWRKCSQCFFSQLGKVENQVLFLFSCFPFAKSELSTTTCPKINCSPHKSMQTNEEYSILLILFWHVQFKIKKKRIFINLISLLIKFFESKQFHKQKNYFFLFCFSPFKFSFSFGSDAISSILLEASIDSCKILCVAYPNS